MREDSRTMPDMKRAGNAHKIGLYRHLRTFENLSENVRMIYNKLFKLLIDKGMKKTDLAKEAKLTPATLAKLSKQETVSMDTLIRICDCLDCTFDDVVELIKD